MFHLSKDINKTLKSKGPRKSVPLSKSSTYRGFHLLSGNCIYISPWLIYFFMLFSVGTLLHFNNPNQNMSNIYFIDPVWFKDILLSLQDPSIAKQNHGHLTLEQVTGIISSPTYKFDHGYFKFLQSFQIGFNTSKYTMQIAHFMRDKKLNSIQKPKIFEGCHSFSRLHAFNFLPFGFWLQLISRILFLFPTMLLETNFSYKDYRRAASTNLQDLFKDKLDYWKQGIVYQDEENAIYISVSQIDIATRFPRCKRLKGKTVIETEVISRDTKTSARILAFAADHIRTLIVEWHGHLSQTDGKDAGVIQYVPCRTCVQGKKQPPRLFSVKECLTELLKADFNPDTKVFCDQHQFHRSLSISLLYPELLFDDHPQFKLLKCHSLQFKKEHQPKCGGEGKVYRGVLIPHHCCNGGKERICARGSCSLYRKKLDVLPKHYNVAIKQRYFSASDIDYVDKFYDFRQEVLMLNNASVHPNIVAFYGIELGSHYEMGEGEKAVNQLTMVMEYASHGSLADELEHLEQRLDRVFIYRVAYQIIDAIAFLHSLEMLYRDLKPDNVLLFSRKITDEVNVKIGDFGTANLVGGQGMGFPAGTPRYFAPEIVNKQSGYTQAVDVWCFGHVLYELVTGNRPFFKIESNKVADHLKIGKRPKFSPGTRKEFQLFSLKSLIKRCWEENPAERPSARITLVTLLSPCFQLLMNSSCNTSYKDLTFLTTVSSQNSREVLYLSVDSRKLHVFDTESVDYKECIDLNSVRAGNRLDCSHPFSDADLILNFQVVGKAYAVSVIRKGSSLRFVVIKLSSMFYSEPRTVQCFGSRVCETINPSTITQFKELGDRNISKMVCNENAVFIYYDNQPIENIYEFQNGKFNWRKAQLLDKDYIDLADMLLLDDTFILGYSRHVNVYQVFYKGRSLGDETRIDLSDRRLKSLYGYKKMILLNYAGCSEFSVIIYDTSPISIRQHMYFNMNAENSIPICLSICSFCCINDTFWIGTTAGFILIFSIKTSDGINCCIDLVQKIHPYDSEVKQLVGVECIQLDDSYVISYGHVLNEAAFNDCKGEHVFSFNRAFLQQQRDGVDASDLLLFWHAIPADALKRYPTDDRNNNNDAERRVISELTTVSKHC